MSNFLIDIFESLFGKVAIPSQPEMDRFGGHLDYDQRVWVQERLKDLGYYPHKIYRDFVPGLIRAVEAFQMKHGLIVDGIVGPKTWDALVKAKVTDKVPDNKAYPWFTHALRDEGLTEIVGPAHSPRVLQMFEKAGHPQITNDETAWCAAALNCWLVETGYKGTGSLLARSFLKWGRPYKQKLIKPGVICVFERGNKPWMGHVALATGRVSNDQIEILGGNQNNAVNRKWYPKNKLLGLRVPKEV